MNANRSRKSGRGRHGFQALHSSALVRETPESFEGLVELAESTLLERGLLAAGDKILVIGGMPAGRVHGSNFIKIQVVQ
jgi:pyruvate kinase